MKPITFAVLFVTLLTSSSALRILAILPYIGKSHFLVFEPIVEELAVRGHEVVVLSHFPRKRPLENYRDITLVSQANQAGGISVIRFDDVSSSFIDRLKIIFLINEFARETCEKHLFLDSVQNLAKEKFDVILLEAFKTDCYLGLVHRLQAPFIHLSSSQIMPWYSERFGQPDNPSYISNMFAGFSDRMSFFERNLNTIAYLAEYFAYNYYFAPQDYALSRKAFGDIPRYEEIAQNVTLLLVNGHFTITRPKPLVPGIIDVSGIHITEKSKSKLPKNIEKWINESEHGVIYFSMGSMIKGHTFPEEKRKIFLRAFGRLKQRVLWKWENDTMPGKPDNVMIQKWMPQFDILCHPNVKAFISHGGLLGTTEAVHCGVPVVVMPQFGDQHTNAKALEAGNGGVILNFRDADEEAVYKALKAVLDPEFNKKAKELSARFRDRPMSPMDTAIYWIEYVARHKGAHHMRTAAVGMPLYQYLLLDVFAFLALIVIVTFVVFFYTLKFFLCFLKSLFASPKKVKKN